jgi:hypothetical protein
MVTNKLGQSHNSLPYSVDKYNNCKGQLHFGRELLTWAIPANPAINEPDPSTMVESNLTTPYDTIYAIFIERTVAKFKTKQGCYIEQAIELLMYFQTHPEHKRILFDSNGYTDMVEALRH